MKKILKQKVNKKKIFIISIILLGCLFAIGFLFFISKSLTIKMKGDNKVTLEVNSKYIEKGAVAKNLFGKIKVIKTGTVNTKKLGTYTITYKAKYLLGNKKITRQVKVVDTEKPTIKLKGSSEVVINLGADYQEEGYIVSDNYDKKLDKKVKINSNVNKDKEGTYEIVYEVEDSSHNKASIKRVIKIVNPTVYKKNSYSSQTESKGTYINGILIVNKKYTLPANYNPGVNPTAKAALEKLQIGAQNAGFSMPIISGFRSYETQSRLYNNYVARDGEAKANTYSAKPGQSEHQTGLAFDVGALDDNYGNTAAGRWLSENAHKYGFIIRYMKGKENITGYQYEPWHIRYVGETVAADIYSKGLTLEEYLGVA